MDYQSDDKWPGPRGQRTLQVTLWGANHLAAEKLNRQHVVYIRNMRPKTATSGLLEATLYGDTKFKDKKEIRLLSHDEHRDVVAQISACASSLPCWIFSGLTFRGVVRRRAAYEGVAENFIAPVFNMSKSAAPAVVPHNKSPGTPCLFDLRHS